jgi:hypothetical protein
VVTESVTVVKLMKLGKFWCPGHMDIRGMRTQFLQKKNFDRRSPVRARRTGNNIKSVADKPEGLLILRYSASV